MEPFRLYLNATWNMHENLSVPGSERGQQSANWFHHCSCVSPFKATTMQGKVKSRSTVKAAQKDDILNHLSICLASRQTFSYLKKKKNWQKQKKNTYFRWSNFINSIVIRSTASATWARIIIAPIQATSFWPKVLLSENCQSPR